MQNDESLITGHKPLNAAQIGDMNMVKHLGKLKFNAALVRAVMDTYDINRVENTFHVKLTDKTAAMVLALNTVRGYSRSEFLRSVKPMKFNLGTVESKLKAEAKKAEKKNAKKDAKG